LSGWDDHVRVLKPETISTKRLVLEPLDETVAQAVIAGDVSALEHADGWPHDDTGDAIRMSTAVGRDSFVWLVRLSGLLIGECGTVGDVDEAGDVEIGYGLAAEHRRQGYGNELVAALSRWLLNQPGVERVVAREVLAGNVASWRALENAGFVLEREHQGLRWYALESG
jgi:[ribosomal protein S5]-alanine N-acetyltransferase